MKKSRLAWVVLGVVVVFVIFSGAPWELWTWVTWDWSPAVMLEFSNASVWLISKRGHEEAACAFLEWDLTPITYWHAGRDGAQETYAYEEAVVANPKQEAEQLIDATLPFAKRMLSEHDEFHPFGAIMRNSGDIVQIAAADPSTDTPEAATLIESMKCDLRERAGAGELRAYAIVFNVHVTLPDDTGKSDAVQINIEHREGYCAEVFFPYTIGEPGEPDFGSTFAQQGDPCVFDRE